MIFTNILLFVVVAEKSTREQLEEMIEEQRKPAGNRVCKLILTDNMNSTMPIGWSATVLVAGHADKTMIC